MRLLTSTNECVVNDALDLLQNLLYFDGCRPLILSAVDIALISNLMNHPNAIIKEKVKRIRAYYG